MSRLARTISESGVYHILFRGVNQQNIFEEASDFEKLKETIATVKQWKTTWERTFFGSVLYGNKKCVCFNTLM